MPRYESRTYPFPLKQYLESNVKASTAFTLKSKRFLGKKSKNYKRSNKHATHQPGQLSLFQVPTSHQLAMMTSHTKGTQTMPNFASILDQPAADVKPPPLIPVGTYHTVIQGLPEAGQSSKKQTDYFKFTHRIVAALDDVDQGALAESFPEGITGKTIDNTLYLTEKSLFMLTDMLKNCGIDFGEDISVRAAVDQTPNAEVGIVIKHEPSEDGQRIFARVARTVALGE